MTWGDRVRGEIDRAYRMHMPDAIKLATLLTGGGAGAHDVAQDAFIAVASRVALNMAPDDFRAYLRRAVANRVLQEHRGSERSSHREYLAAQHAISPRDVSSRWETHADLDAALSSLSWKQRAAVVLRYYCDLPEAAIAELLVCKPGTVKSILSRSMEILRHEEALDGYGD